MKKIVSLAFFLFFALGSFLWFSISLALTLGQIVSSHSVVSIDKGSYYLLGGAIALGALLVDGVYTSILNKPLPERLSKILVRVIILGLVLIFVLPQLLHYGMRSFLVSHGYEYCEFNSSQWLHVHSLEFRNDGNCVAE